MQVVSQSMSSKCINNSKLNSYGFKSSTIFFLNANKNAHYAMLNMIHTFGSLHSPSVSNHGHITIQKMINN